MTSRFSPSGFGAAIREVLDVAAAAYGAAHTERTAVLDIRRRLDEPLRVAVAGRVKSGKSTIVNALVGDIVAATDVGECTRHVIWYCHGRNYRATVKLRDGSATEVALRRSPGGTIVDVGRFDPAEVIRIVVEWPAPLLESLVLVDTPGLGSLRSEDDRRSRSFLGADGVERSVDAVIYLSRHLHPADVAFLQAFHDADAGPPSPADTIGVLSRADEIAGGRADAMEVAGRVAGRWRDDQQARRLCQTVVTVAGLLATGAGSYTETYHRVVTALAALPTDRAATLLASADRIARSSWPAGPDPVERTALIERLGLFGVRCAHRLVLDGADASEVSCELRRLSGIDHLQQLLHTQFTQQASLLRARSALRDLEHVLEHHPIGSEHDAMTVESAIERYQAGAHELAELKLLVAVRSGEIGLDRVERDEIERLLTTRSADLSARLGLDPGTDVAAAVLSSIERWRRRAEHPATGPTTAEAADIVTRSFEGIYADLLR